MKRKIYAPDTKPAPAGVPRNPYTKSNKPFNAWAEQLVGPQGFPKEIVAVDRTRGDDKKRKAGGQGEDGVEEREVLFDGVRFTARRKGGDGGEVEIVDEATVGAGEGGWETGKVLRFVISKKDGALDGAKEEGEFFNFSELKTQLLPICKPAFVSLLPESRAIAALPAGGSAMAIDTPAPSSEFPVRLTAPPTIGSASAPADTKPAGDKKGQEYPAKGQCSFREVVTDEIFEKIKSTFGLWEGRKIEWTRASGPSGLPTFCFSH